MKLFKRKKKNKLEKKKDKVFLVCGILWFIGALVLYITSRSTTSYYSIYLCGLYICLGILFLILAYKYKK